MAPSKFTRKAPGSPDAFMKSIDKDRLRYKAMQAYLRSCSRAARYPLVNHLKVRSLMSNNKSFLKVTKMTEDAGYFDTHLIESSDVFSPESDIEMGATDTEADQMTVVSDDMGNDTDAERKIETMEAESGTETSASDDPHPKDEALLRELRLQAIGIRDIVIEEWKRRKTVGTLKEDISQKLPTVWGKHRKMERAAKCREGEATCPFKDYKLPSGAVNKAQAFRRHLLTHYPEAYFCPACCKSFCREDSLDRHLQMKGSDCLKNALAKGLRMWRGIDGKLRRGGLARKYFNVYFLGAMEDFEMPEEHFEMIARRRRHSPLL